MQGPGRCGAGRGEKQVRRRRTEVGERNPRAPAIPQRPGGTAGTPTAAGVHPGPGQSHTGVPRRVEKRAGPVRFEGEHGRRAVSRASRKSRRLGSRTRDDGSIAARQRLSRDVPSRGTACPGMATAIQGGWRETEGLRHSFRPGTGLAFVIQITELGDPRSVAGCAAAGNELGRRRRSCR